MKLGRYHRNRGDRVKLVRGLNGAGYDPDIIYVTSLFTYAWQPVHEVIRYYLARYPKAKLTVGGIYATLCTDHLREEFGYRIRIQKGVVPELDDLRPDYSLVPDWNASIVFASRGCIRKCPFCSVPMLEPEFTARKTIRRLIHPRHKRIIFWDNNILASPHWRDIFAQLAEFGKPVDFNQGLDARLLTEEMVEIMRKFPVPNVRLAYDTDGIREPLKKAIDLLRAYHYDGRRIIVYCLYNHSDHPDTFFHRVRDLIDRGVVAYPMRYEPLKPRPKNTYISRHWTAEQLEMVAQARRVIGYGGAFPPYEGLRKKFDRAKDFEKAFRLRPRKK
ncbi:hypothetical protein CH330_08450 [candidate division WOR-3 bacterium JGI_Cruoil_03_51_56]|uniref:Elp3/MiaA/NifB-like radical SAM core domain-containing protein n=1 Tax=candidate division WOR-3 bacterium JGI_Cruoil_03_51_56 TaxID=1973747 RepID=A0A235BQM5_UNCW3|nr:MAG: hypothetical protein CH330_08450 [candidate division WOR-3 bacterium JGI_Cruoil_03_51_56]